MPELSGRYVFGDIVNGRIFHVGIEDLEQGREAEIEELVLLRDGQPITLLDLVDAPRADLRFGQDGNGEIYITTKQDGMVRTLAPPERGVVVPEPALDSLLSVADAAQAVGS
jgi:hypothetical protein